MIVEGLVKMLIKFPRKSKKKGEKKKNRQNNAKQTMHIWKTKQSKAAVIREKDHKVRMVLTCQSDTVK